MNKIITLLALLTFPIHGLCENLTDKDYIGEWKSNWVAVKGEKQRLIISPDKSSMFERKYEDSLQQHKAESYEKIDDLLILKYSFNEGNNIYKLVLSGWRIDNSRRLYGTMYMYNNGKSFNGLPVSFAIEE